MKRKFEVLRATLEEFAQQDEFPILPVGCRGDELAYVLQFLQALEQSLPSHLVAAFSQPFTAPGPWLDAVVQTVVVQLEYAAPARAERGEPPAPALPEVVTDSRAQPQQRLAALLHYLTQLLPNPTDYRIAGSARSRLAASASPMASRCCAAQHSPSLTLRSVAPLNLEVSLRKLGASTDA